METRTVGKRQQQRRNAVELAYCLTKAWDYYCDLQAARPCGRQAALLRSWGAFNIDEATKHTHSATVFRRLAELEKLFA